MFLILSAIFISACTEKSVNELLPGKWKVVKADFSQMKEFANLSDEQKVSLEMMNTVFSKVEFEFFKDLTFSSSAPDIGEMKKMNTGGSYQLVNDGRYLELKEKSGNTDKMKILLCTEDSLKLHTKEGFILVFTSVKQ